MAQEPLLGSNRQGMVDLLSLRLDSLNNFPGIFYGRRNIDLVCKFDV